MQSREPSELSSIPEGFDAFWRKVWDEADSAEVNYSFIPGPSRSTPDHEIERVKFRGVNGEPLQGWIALPAVHHPAPGFLWIPPYSRWSMQPDEYGTRKGYASLSFNFFGEDAFHQEAYTPARGYFAQGVYSPETWIFRTMAANAMLAAKILADHPRVDGERLGAGGMSQGGGISIWLGAFCPSVRCVFADMPFLGDIRPILENAKAYRYPLKELADWVGGDEERQAQLFETLRWFDTAHLATRCSVPTLLTLGLKDPAVRPQQVHAIKAALAGESKLVELDWGHDWQPTMVDRNRDWLAAHL